MMILVCETISPAQQIGQFAESAFKQYAQEIIDLRTQLAAAQAHIEKAHAFINAAAGEGLVLDGIDAAELYVQLYPERYAAELEKS